jgi:hypothetical protein
MRYFSILLFPRGLEFHPIWAGWAVCQFGVHHELVSSAIFLSQFSVPVLPSSMDLSMAMAVCPSQPISCLLMVRSNSLEAD